MCMSASMAGHQQRMDHVGLAGVALLALVALGGEAEGLFERRKIFVGAILADPGFEFAVELFDGIVGADGTRARQTRRIGGTLLQCSRCEYRRRAVDVTSCHRCGSITTCMRLLRSARPMMPPVVGFRAALTFLVSSAFCTQSSAISICFLYSSVLSARSARLADQQVHVRHGVVVLGVDLQRLVQILQYLRR